MPVEGMYMVPGRASMMDASNDGYKTIWGGITKPPVASFGVEA